MRQKAELYVVICAAALVWNSANVAAARDDLPQPAQYRFTYERLGKREKKRGNE
jgi:hypothetical protein